MSSNDWLVLSAATPGATFPLLATAAIERGSIASRRGLSRGGIDR
jgi:hypothetical protein